LHDENPGKPNSTLVYSQTGRSHLLLISNTPGIAGGATGIITLEDIIEVSYPLAYVLGGSVKPSLPFAAGNNHRGNRGRN